MPAFLVKPLTLRTLGVGPAVARQVEGRIWSGHASKPSEGNADRPSTASPVASGDSPAACNLLCPACYFSDHRTTIHQAPVVRRDDPNPAG